MQQISTTERGILNSTVPFSFSGFLRQYLLNPLKAGLFGFAVYFSFLIAVKSVGVFIGSQDFFFVDILDVALAGIGAFFFCLIKLLENFRDEN